MLMHFDIGFRVPNLPKAVKHMSKRTTRNKSSSGVEFRYAINGEQSIPAVSGQIHSASNNDVTTSQSASSASITFNPNEQATVTQPSVESVNRVQRSAGVPALCQLTTPSPGASVVKVSSKPQLPVIISGLSVKVPRDEAPQQIIAKELSSFGYAVVSPNSKRVLLVKPVVAVPSNSPSLKLASSVSAKDAARPDCRPVLHEKQLIRTPLTTSGQTVARPLLPRGFLIGNSSLRPVSTSLSLPTNRQPARPPPRLIVKTKMLIFNRPLAPKKTDVPSVLSSPDDNSTAERESPLSCLEQLVANAAADVSKAISDVEFGTEETPMSYCGSSLAEFSANISYAKHSSRAPLDLTMKSPQFQKERRENMQLHGKSDDASKSQNDGCCLSTDGDESSQIQASGRSDEPDRIPTILDGTSGYNSTESGDSVSSRPVTADNSVMSVPTVIIDETGEAIPPHSLRVSLEASPFTICSGSGESDDALNLLTEEAELEDSVRRCKALNLRRSRNQLTDEGSRKKMKQS